MHEKFVITKYAFICISKNAFFSFFRLNKIELFVCLFEQTEYR